MGKSQFKSPPSLKGFSSSKKKKEPFTNPVTTLLMGFVFALLVLALMEARKEMKMDEQNQVQKTQIRVSDRPEISASKELPPDPDKLFAKEAPIVATPDIRLEPEAEASKELQPLQMDIDTDLSTDLLDDASLTPPVSSD